MAFVAEAEAAQHRFRGFVRRGDEGDEAVDVVGLDQMADQRRNRFFGIALALEGGEDAVADLDLALAGDAEAGAEIADQRAVLAPFDDILVPGPPGSASPGALTCMSAMSWTRKPRGSGRSGVQRLISGSAQPSIKASRSSARARRRTSRSLVAKIIGLP
jgi:hypothetical protein